LERLAVAIFQAWFVDFEPVKAKAAGATNFPGMAETAFDALPNGLVDSEPKTLPVGWSITTLRDIAMFISGGTPSKKEDAFWGGNFPWVSAKDMHERIVYDSELRLTDAGRESVRRLAPRHATLLVVRGMSLMTEVRIGWCAREVAFNQDLRAFVAKEGVSPEFVFLWLTSSQADLMQMVDTASHGTGRILTYRLDAMTIAKPPEIVMEQFTSVVRPMMELRESLERESRKLAELRDYLLPKLLSGTVRVKSDGDIPGLADGIESAKRAVQSRLRQGGGGGRGVRVE
jgi:type I restriction enzyme S subunit